MSYRVDARFNESFLSRQAGKAQLHLSDSILGSLRSSLWDRLISYNSGINPLQEIEEWMKSNNLTSLSTADRDFVKQTVAKKLSGQFINPVGWNRTLQEHSTSVTLSKESVVVVDGPHDGKHPVSSYGVPLVRQDRLRVTDLACMISSFTSMKKGELVPTIDTKQVKSYKGIGVKWFDSLTYATYVDSVSTVLETAQSPVFLAACRDNLTLSGPEFLNFMHDILWTLDYRYILYLHNLHYETIMKGVQDTYPESFTDVDVKGKSFTMQTAPIVKLQSAVPEQTDLSTALRVLTSSRLFRGEDDAGMSLVSNAMNTGYLLRKDERFDAEFASIVIALVMKGKRVCVRPPKIGKLPGIMDAIKVGGFDKEVKMLVSAHEINKVLLPYRSYCVTMCPKGYVMLEMALAEPEKSKELKETERNYDEGVREHLIALEAMGVEEFVVLRKVLTPVKHEYGGKKVYVYKRISIHAFDVILSNIPEMFWAVREGDYGLIPMTHVHFDQYPKEVIFENLRRNNFIVSRKRNFFPVVGILRYGRLIERSIEVDLDTGEQIKKVQEPAREVVRKKLGIEDVLHGMSVEEVAPPLPSLDVQPTYFPVTKENLSELLPHYWEKLLTYGSVMGQPRDPVLDDWRRRTGVRELRAPDQKLISDAILQHLANEAAAVERALLVQKEKDADRERQRAESAIPEVKKRMKQDLLELVNDDEVRDEAI